MFCSRLSAITALLLLLTSPPTLFATIPPLDLELVAEGQFGAPTAVTHAGDGSGRLFIADQRGTIHILVDEAVLPTPFLDISTKLVPERAGFDERGLLGLAFHPDFASGGAAGEGKLYVYYSAPSPNAPGTTANPVDHMSVVAEFNVSAGDPNLADGISERILLTFDQPQFNHDAGQIAFGPVDKLLYIATGDGGSSNDNNAGHTGGSAARPTTAPGNSQDRSNLLGNILRIDPFGNNGPGGQFGIPATNPFIGEGGGVREEIYAYGLRNPWRFSFDDGPGGTNRLFCADVGQGDVEEVNLIVPGGNCGWRNKEGVFFPSFSVGAPPLAGMIVDPIAQYAHPGVVIGVPPLLQVGRSVTGGHVYRGNAIPALQGIYVFADWSTDFSTPNGTMLGLEETSLLSGLFDISILDIAAGNPIGRYIPGFGEDEAGEIYVATKTSLGPSAPDPGTNLPAGQLFRIVAPPLALTHRQQWERLYFPAGTFLPANGDDDLDLIGLLLEYAWFLDPTVQESMADFFQVDVDLSGDQVDIDFRRDPRATDLDYILEASGDLVAWSPLVTVSGGAAPIGSAFVSEAVDPGNADLRIVSAVDPVAPSAGGSRFVRLRVLRP